MPLSATGAIVGSRREIRSFVPATVSRANTSKALFQSPSTRLPSGEVKTTTRPSALTLGKVFPRSVDPAPLVSTSTNCSAPDWRLSRYRWKPGETGLATRFVALLKNTTHLPLELMAGVKEIVLGGTPPAFVLTAQSMPATESHT